MIKMGLYKKVKEYYPKIMHGVGAGLCIAGGIQKNFQPFYIFNYYVGAAIPGWNAIEKHTELNKESIKGALKGIFKGQTITTGFAIVCGSLAIGSALHGDSETAYSMGSMAVGLGISATASEIEKRRVKNLEKIVGHEK